MKQHQEVPKPFAITIIAIIIVCLLIVIFQPMANASELPDKTKLCKKMSWKQKRSLKRAYRY